MSDWSNYPGVLKEGFTKSRVYVHEKDHLLEKASCALKDSFSVDYILSYCMDKNNFQDLSFQQRQMFTKEVFEIYFSYSKNILLYFDIYSQKSITEGTSQVVNYLSKIPGFSTHLALIGYIYQDDRREWRYLETRLTGERKEELQFITVCCCLGHSYIDEPLKFLSLTIFQERETSFRNLMKVNLCEYCNLELDLQHGRCLGCDQEIISMKSFQDWTFSYSTVDRGHDLYLRERVTESKNHDLDFGKVGQNIPATLIETWQCSLCTCINPMTCNSCMACFTLKDTVTMNERGCGDKNEDLNKEFIHNKDKREDILTEDKRLQQVKELQTCPNCTCMYEKSIFICPACLNIKEELNEDEHFPLTKGDVDLVQIALGDNNLNAAEDNGYDMDPEYKSPFIRRNDNQPWKKDHPENTLIDIGDTKEKKVSNFIITQIISLLIILYVFIIGLFKSNKR